MVEVKWIKIVTNLFDNRKIKQIRKMPEGDAIIVVWLQILCLAGQVNDNGMVIFSKDVPYTEEMLATEFDRPINIVRLALVTFEKFGMIEIIDDILLVSNWEKYQSTEKLEKLREQTRKRVAKHRQKQVCNVTGNADVTQCNAIDREEDIDIDKEIDIDRSINTSMSVGTDVVSATFNRIDYNSLLNYWNINSKLKEITAITDKRKGNINARFKEYGLESIYKVIDNCGNSSFIRGHNSRNWMADFDWVFKPNNFIKVLEGNYLDKSPNDFNDIEERAKKVKDFFSISG